MLFTTRQQTIQAYVAKIEKILINSSFLPRIHHNHWLILPVFQGIVLIFDAFVCLTRNQIAFCNFRMNNSFFLHVQQRYGVWVLMGHYQFSDKVDICRRLYHSFSRIIIENILQILKKRLALTTVRSSSCTRSAI